jgi:hypothetical protein
MLYGPSSRAWLFNIEHPARIENLFDPSPPADREPGLADGRCWHGLAAPFLL